MSAAPAYIARRPLHPVHAVLLAGTVPLFLGAFLSDIAYAQTYEIQWKNFSSWLLVGVLIFGGLALVCALAGLFSPARRSRRRVIYFGLLLAAWIVGFLSALVHAKDAWASMPDALILSGLGAALILAATALGFSTYRAEV